MLKNIPPILSPELLKVLCEMGHGDEIILADGNFPAESIGKDAIVIRADGHGTVELLEAILQFLPLDQYVEKPVALMKVVDGDPCKPTIWDSYKQKLNFFQQCFHIPAEVTVLFDGDIFKTMDFLVGEVLAIVHGSNCTSTGSAKVEGQHSCCVTHCTTPFFKSTLA